jgi:hypothetical protein
LPDRTDFRDDLVSNLKDKCLFFERIAQIIRCEWRALEFPTKGR